jgi:hypothetical protein
VWIVEKGGWREGNREVDSRKWKVEAGNRKWAVRDE